MVVKLPLPRRSLIAMTVGRLPASLSFWAAAATSLNSTNFLAMSAFLLNCNVYGNYRNTVITVILYYAVVDWNCLCGTKPFVLLGVTSENGIYGALLQS